MNIASTTIRRSPAITLLAALAIFTSARSSAQAPPGPLPQAAAQDASVNAQTTAPRPGGPRTKSLAGIWRLNQEESDDPAKKLQQARGSDRGSGSGRRGGVGMGGGMGGHGGYGGRGPGDTQSDADRAKMHQFLEPSRELGIAQKEPEIDVAEDADRKLALYTDNRKIAKSKDQTHQEFAAKWEEFRLIAEGQDPRGKKYQRSYEVLEGNQQLRETLLVKFGRNDTEISIRYVYDLVSPATSASRNSH